MGLNQNREEDLQVWLKVSNLYIYKFRWKIKADKEKSTEKIDGVIAMVSNKVWNGQVNRFKMIEGLLFFMGINY